MEGPMMPLPERPHFTPGSYQVVWPLETIKAFRADYGLDAEMQVLDGVARVIEEEQERLARWDRLPWIVRLACKIWWTAEPLLVKVRQALL